jgi:hypothetical protein
MPRLSLRLAALPFLLAIPLMLGACKDNADPVKPKVTPPPAAAAAAAAT